MQKKTGQKSKGPYKGARYYVLPSGRRVYLWGGVSSFARPAGVKNRGPPVRKSKVPEMREKVKKEKKAKTGRK